MRGVAGTAFVGRCVGCGKELSGIRPNRFRRNPNRKCNDCYRKTVRGFTFSEGYIRLHESQGKRYLHRVLAEEKIGRKLTKRERVHHLNENKTDNRPSNLKVCASAGSHVWGEGHVSRNPVNGRFCPNAADFRKKANT